MSGDALAVVLRVGLRHAVTVANAEAAYDEIAALAGAPLEAHAFHAAIAEAVARGLIRDPIQIPEGSLQCQWHLELTAAGVAAARATEGYA